MLTLLITAALAASPTESPTPAATATVTATEAVPATTTPPAQPAATAEADTKPAITLSPQKSELNQPSSNKSLIEISAKLNATLPETEKIIIPSQGSRQFFSQLAVFQKSSTSAQTAKKFLKLSDLFLQGCNAYSASGVANVNWQGAIESFDITNAQVRRQGNFKNAENLVRIALTTAQCKGPIALNNIGAGWLEKSIETLKSMNMRRIKKHEKMRLKALKEQVLGLDAKEILQASLRFEVLISSAEIMKTLAEVPPAHAETPEDIFNNLLLLDEEGKPRQISTEVAAEIVLKILHAVQNSKTYLFPEYTAEMDKQIKEGRDGIINDLDLKDQGFTSYEKFQDEAFMESFSKRLTSDPDLLKRAKKNIAKHPEINTHLFQHHLAIYKVDAKAFETFNKYLSECHKEAKNLVK
ncbi:hypothetical protein [Bdellovibrio sp. HCB274]|uniref:hypothetical protein n=1 Tax=Bdellovibrio sp. HCB274 TaxID=3394361 RepID=UPI0039B4B530